MKTNYFESDNLQDLKKEYFSLAKKYHTDLGGDLETMKAINNEYDYLKTILPNKKSKDDKEKIFAESVESMGIFRDIIEKILRFEDITVEIVGSWLWVKGQGTFKIKDILIKELKFRYSKSQKSFYWFNGIEKQKGKRKGGYLNRAKEIYNVITFESEGTKQLA